MKQVFVAALVTVGLASAGVASVGLAQSNLASAAAEREAHYSRSELRQLQREAHTPQQYHRLATYYAQQQQSYQQKADSEKQEWDRRSVNIVGPAAKGFRPVDSSRNRSQYFASQASQAGTFSSHYQRMEQSAQMASVR